MNVLDLKKDTQFRMIGLTAELNKIIQLKLGSSYNGQKYYEPSSLLGTASAKTIKGLKKGFSTYIMYLSPSTLNSKGKNLCSGATAGCIESCLFTSGRGSFSMVELARVNKTEFFLHDREKFLDRLVAEIASIELKHSKMTEDIHNADGSIKRAKNVAIRLNGTSDIPWANIKLKKYNNKNIFELFPNIQFYDYTKVKSQVESARSIKNYHVVFSQSESNILDSLDLFNSGSNFASVFFPQIPSHFMGLSVYDGDESDLIFTYPTNKVIGLYLKVPRKTRNLVNLFIKKAVESGFVSLVLNNQIVEVTDENIQKATEIYFELKNKKLAEKRKNKIL